MTDNHRPIRYVLRKDAKGLSNKEVGEYIFTLFLILDVNMFTLVICLKSHKERNSTFNKHHVLDFI